MTNNSKKKGYSKPQILAKKLINSYFKRDRIPLSELEGVLLAGCVTCGPCGGEGCTPICR